MMIVTKVHQLIWDQGKLAANSSCSPLLLWPHRFILLHYVESSVLCSNIFERTPTSTIIAAGCVFCTCKMVCMFVCVHRRAAPKALKAEHALLGAVCGGTKSGWRQYPLQLQEPGNLSAILWARSAVNTNLLVKRVANCNVFYLKQEALVFLFVSGCVGWIPSTSLAISRPQYKLIGSLQTQNHAFPKKQDIEGHVCCRPEYGGARLVC